jgi:hypothetical protein
MSVRILVGFKLVAASVPPGCSQGIDGRAAKNPEAPNEAARLALICEVWSKLKVHCVLFC